ncbi:uncharacterized protein MONBRDRAFT_5425 [Monosiga brevicollis MX1]|uniref:Protein-S-isoprenylcysteine O-methyltransferase n=1 Tax=Monosiga brevicollis TaxID=81824 RepID=A9UQY3_MONBE|nr:uncharacterized protein MONBRDRAFT_5425 [Monosiga brevicollis MX1]EDQ93126.1 predicted protein [Monosiga brevicollis MX1]|eukprot:XP_001742888.1 hypothetical protein [Monosiga brevicollis MX1]
MSGVLTFLAKAVPQFGSHQQASDGRPKPLLYPPGYFTLGAVAIYLNHRFRPLSALDEPFAAALGRAAAALPFRNLLRVDQRWMKTLGVVSILTGVYCAMSASGQFKTHETDVVPFENVTALVQDGWFEVTRNPMYLGLTTTLVGGMFYCGQVSSLLVVGTVFVIIDKFFVPREEAMMRSIFGLAFDDYCARVPRWL